jgi:serine/threonine protein kinase
MTLAPGARLGPYEVSSLVGSGGMGEVYRARDPRLGRDVAIKVLPAGFSLDPERLRRFELEARAAAALSHANILAVYDIGTHDGSPYIVSELLEGETLRDRMNGAALPVRKATEYAVQIARGLAAAHDKGIVHRDLKPENVFLALDGRVRILDFGLAKLIEAQPAGSGASTVPTMLADTKPGLVLGTVGYMSPEQVRGLPTDHRTDIFAFGAMLYEMLAGRPAFRAETAADRMSAILKEDPPDLPTAERQIPPALARIVDRCLQKNPQSRFQSSGDLAFALEALSAHSGATEVVAAGAVRSQSRERLAWLVAAILGLGLITAASIAAILYVRRAPAETAMMRFTIEPPEGWRLALGTAPAGSGNVALGPLSVSPDGRRIAIIARNPEGQAQIWIRPFDASAPQPLSATEDASSPFWSPDSRFLGFFAEGKLKKIEVVGGPPTVLCNVTGGSGGTWNRDGVIVFASIQSPLQKVDSSGGIPTVAVPLESAETAHTRPLFLDDGRHVIFRALESGIPGQGRTIYVASLDSGKRTKLLQSDSTNVFFSEGHLLFLRGTTLMAQPFDADRLMLTGEPVPIADEIQTLGSPQSGVFSASKNGVLAYQTGTASNWGQPTWLDHTGKPVAAIGDPAIHWEINLSPDGRRAAVSIFDQSQTTDIWLLDVVRGLRTRFTFDPSNDRGPVWSPDGERLVFDSNRSGTYDLYQRAASGAGADELLYADRFNKEPVSWSPDGRHILYTAFNKGDDLWVLPLEGDRRPVPFADTPFSEVSGQFSPDGRWIAYASNESGRYDIYVAPFPPTGGKWMVSRSGGLVPRWRRDSAEIFYFDGARQMAAAVDGRGTAFEVGSVRALFTPLYPVRVGETRAFYDVSSDGRRFLVNLAAAPPTSPRPVSVVLNWTAMIKR